MNELKVGMYVVPKNYEDINLVQRIEKIQHTSYGIYISFNTDLGGDSANYRQTTVLDFIRTMSAKLLADIMAFRTHYFCMNLCSSDDSCRGCESHIEEILEQPLTDETIWKLGSIEE